MRLPVLLGRLAPACLLAVFPLVSAQAGLFDFINQGTPEPQAPPAIERPAPVDLPPVHALPRYRVETLKHITVLHKSTPEKPATDVHRSAGLRDETLREGDAVMTQHGIRIFAGSSVDGRNFITLAETKGLAPAERIALAEIDAHRSEDGWQSKSAGAGQLITGRSAATTSHAWKWVRDPKGQIVRYVGP